MLSWFPLSDLETESISLHDIFLVFLARTSKDKSEDTLRYIIIIIIIIIIIT